MTLGKTFKALSDPQRREILELIKKNYLQQKMELCHLRNWISCIRGITLKQT